MKTIKRVLLIGAVLFVALNLHAQLSVQSIGTVPAAPDSIVQVTAEAQGLQQVALADLPFGGIYWWVQAGGAACPMPFPPQDPNAIIYAITDTAFLVDQTGGQVTVNQRQLKNRALTQSATSDVVASALENQATAIVNLINQVQTASASQQMRTMAGAMGVPMPGDGGGDSGGGDVTNNYTNYTWDTNQLWLQITNVSNNTTFANLHNGTNQVYAIWGTTNLVTPFNGWQVETELWPTDTNCQPFTVQNDAGQNLFLRAEDWTGIDSDGDGIPDWWIWKYFHTLDLNATNLDSQGNMLGYDYTNGIDPNVILFTVEAANDYVNTPFANLQLNITAGNPSYYALLVNDQTTTNWLPFVSTNLTVALGATDGVYTVTVGLRGLPADATQTWDDYSFTLDRVAPVVKLTNPIIGSNAVTKPYLQLQGLADEALSRLSYDISNAFGLTTNQNAFVTDQGFDTNKFDFTTNYFQAYDVPLATNANVITLRVTDRAGNTTTTNFTVTLDYTTATNPPTVSLIWPLAGMAVSGTNLTLRGTMSDETGTIVAQIADGDGNTNLVTGLVERNGMFWIENVPLNGESQITLQATDAAGNVTTTNLTIMPSDLVLTIDSTPTGDALWHGAGSVYGTVSDSTATVTVNGLTVTNDFWTDGETWYWSVDNVPIYGQGTATFDAVAVTAGQTLANTRMRAMNQTQNSSTPPPPPTGANANVEMQPYVAMISYNGTEVQKYFATDANGNVYARYNQKVKSETAQPVAGTNGQWVLNDQRINSMYWYEQEGSDSSYGHQKYTWGESPPDAGQEHTDNSWGGSYDGPAVWPDWDAQTCHLLRALPHEDLSWDYGSGNWWENDIWGTVRHYYADGVQYHWDLGGNATFDLSIGAKTQMKLFTGGKAPVSRKNLFEIDASANEILRPPLDHGTGNPWWDVPEPAIAPATLTVAGKAVGADGKLWLVLPDNSDTDLTVIAKGKKHYDANATAQKYKLQIVVNGSNPLWPDHVPAYNNYCVGQYLGFNQEFTPALPEIPQYSPIKWVLDGKFVNEYLPPPSPEDGSGYYTNEPAFLKTTSTHAWWVSGGFNPPATYVASIGEGLTFANGQYVVVTANGKFTMFRPKISGHERVTPGAVELNTNNLPAMKLGMITHFMHWGTDVELDINFPANLFHIQLVDWESIYDAGAYCLSKYDGLNGQYWLDNTPTTADGLWPENPDNSKSYTTNAGVDFGDGPSIGEDVFCSYAQLTPAFKNYLCFQPKSANSIPITLELTIWNEHGRADLINGAWTLTATNISGPNFNDDDSFPFWPHVFHNRGSGN